MESMVRGGDEEKGENKEREEKAKGGGHGGGRKGPSEKAFEPTSASNPFPCGPQKPFP
jgi:hypothetical protein